MKAKVWITGWLLIVAAALTTVSVWVYRIDPFFHYHKPDTDRYFYELYNQRSQNDGISKHFDYDAIITGTSMTENFRTTEADDIFGCNSIKVAFSGGTYKEINDNIVRALKANPDLKLVIRGLDMDTFFKSADAMRNDLGTFPTYLYDTNPFNDLEYLLNRDIVFGKAYQMTIDNDAEDFKPGITTFDDYSRWQANYVFGINTVCPDGITIEKAEKINHLTDEEKTTVKENIDANVTDVAKQYPDVDFYYFYPPYSIVWWAELNKNGNLYKRLEVEEYITELILPYENIHLFSFNNRTDIRTDLNNYKDARHYGCWVNSLMLKWMHDGSYRLTNDNYKDYLKQEKDFYTTYDYESINDQEDYEADFYAAALLNQELTGVMPTDVLNSDEIDVNISGAEYFDDESISGVDCKGTLPREPDSDSVYEYLATTGYIGLSFNVDLDKGYNYLCYSGQKTEDDGMMTVLVLDGNNTLLYKNEVNSPDLDNELHQYVIDLSTFKGEVRVIMHGGYIDNTGSAESGYQYSDIRLY